MKIRLSNDAEKSVKIIGKYTKAHWGTTQERKYIKSLYDKLDELAQSPLRGRERDDLGESVRSYLKDSHIIYYRIKKSHIEIIDILHARMEPGGRVKNK